MAKYDYLVVGAGLFGAIFAHEANKRGKKVLVIDKRDHLAGNIYTKEIEGINVLMKKSGTMSISSLSSTDIQIVRLHIIKDKFTTCLST